MLGNTSVFNLSDVQLSPIETSIIGLGLKYLPRYYRPQNSIIDSINHSLLLFQRKLKWKLYFSISGGSSSNQRNFIPAIINNQSLPANNDNIMEAIDSYILDCKSKVSRNKNNFSCVLSEVDTLIMQVLKQLHQRLDIIIKPADKNLGTVILSIEHYRAMCMNHLLDTKTYELLPADGSFNDLAFSALEVILRTHGVFASKKRILDDWQEAKTPLARSLMQLQGTKYLKTGHFYCLPKVHKQPVLGRPIVGSINTVSYFTSKYLHNILNLVIPRLASICTSSRSVIKELSELTFQDDCYIVCADVKSLYPSIPIDYGVKAVKNVLESLQINVMDIPLIIDLLKWTLENNYLEFDGQVYHQLTGTAMGTPVAVCYANIVLHYLERPCLELNPIFYKRFVDDLFIIVKGKLLGRSIISLFDSQCETIKLDAITIEKEGIFLDLQLRVVDGKIKVGLYQKPMNKYLYIPPSSDHSKSMLHNIIIQEIKRYRLHCEEDEQFVAVCDSFKERLLQRGYSQRYIDPIIAAAPLREELVQQLFLSSDKQYQQQQIYSKSVSKPILTLCIPSRVRGLKPIFSIPANIRDNPFYKNVYGDNDIVIGRKNEKSIGAFLTHKRLKPVEEAAPLKRRSRHHEDPSATRSETPLVGGTRASDRLGRRSNPLLIKNTQKTQKRPRLEQPQTELLPDELVI